MVAFAVVMVEAVEAINVGVEFLNKEGWLLWIVTLANKIGKIHFL